MISNSNIFPNYDRHLHFLLECGQWTRRTNSMYLASGHPSKSIDGSFQMQYNENSDSAGTDRG